MLLYGNVKKNKTRKTKFNWKKKQQQQKNHNIALPTDALILN